MPRYEVLTELNQAQSRALDAKQAQELRHPKDCNLIREASAYPELNQLSLAQKLGIWNQPHMRVGQRRRHRPPECGSQLRPLIRGLERSERATRKRIGQADDRTMQRLAQGECHTSCCGLSGNEMCHGAFPFTS